jgi:hypothetical protein
MFDEHVKAAIEVIEKYSSQASGDPGKILPASYWPLLQKHLQEIVESIMAYDDFLSPGQRTSFDGLVSCLRLDREAWILLADTPGCGPPRVQPPEGLSYNPAVLDKLMVALRGLQTGTKEGNGQPETGSKDDSAWVLASTLWPAKFGNNYKSFKTFIDQHLEIKRRKPISKKTGKPLKNRLELHAGDWVRYWKGQHEKQFDALDDGEHKPITPDPTDETIDRFIEIQAKKKAGK